MLFILADQFKKLKWDCIIPYFNESKGATEGDELLFMMSDTIGFKLTHVQTDSGETLFMKKIMEDKKDVFGTKSFSDRMKDFVQIFETRLERFFITKKSEYMFFDKEEQNFLKQLVDGVNLSCRVEILIKDPEFKVLEFNDITARQMFQIKKYFNRAGISYVCKPEHYFSLKSKAGQVRKEVKPLTPEEKQKKRNKILETYPELNVEGKDAFKKGFRDLSKKLHSDVGGDDKKFQEFMESVKFLKGTKWYKIKIEGGENADTSGSDSKDQ